MVTVRNQTNVDSVMNILNRNVITEKDKKEALKTMGLSACQVGCLGREMPRYYCSAH